MNSWTVALSAADTAVVQSKERAIANRYGDTLRMVTPWKKGSGGFSLNGLPAERPPDPLGHHDQLRLRPWMISADVGVGAGLVERHGTRFEGREPARGPR